MYTEKKEIGSEQSLEVPHSLYFKYLRSHCCRKLSDLNSRPLRPLSRHTVFRLCHLFKEFLGFFGVDPDRKFYKLFAEFMNTGRKFRDEYNQGNSIWGN